MPNPLSVLGIVHTAISLVPVVAGVYSFAKYRSIQPATRSGKVYLGGLLLAVLTAFGLSSTDGFNPGHALGILALLAVSGSLLIPRLSFLGWARPYLATFGLSFSFFLTLVPGINETLTRLPAGQPLASGPEHPLVQGTLLAWVVIFLAGFVFQAWTLRAQKQAK
ncbi:MAG: hypothetical protein A3E00_02955 [Curvibacter sp. RIFCSPHIGHO2_12_FULL_63_18]|uniref:hypothetical protein n=1 Tax=Rhodoferax sp. TaxID=50421 RepID=UPI0008B9F1C6|nr:hypothetical protein [Rhodoferax sp.]OGO98254.1 MAG: hypothetical protein A2037_06565 [Curvibacter sp. GWA2_63_95]OGP06522.1 MAG: hypothetical protein A3E00_02955 [Curvibacter sp. RIFCSPHIGHO2_12_FULL_63_18]HCX82938.1 hypothetical protein [Rhodoferax sp.]